MYQHRKFSHLVCLQHSYSYPCNAFESEPRLSEHAILEVQKPLAVGCLSNGPLMPTNLGLQARTLYGGNTNGLLVLCICVGGLPIIRFRIYLLASTTAHVSK
jgi:hypothetical protein